MTYTYNDDGIFAAVPEAKKLILNRPIGMNRKQWAEYAVGVICALNNRAAQDPVEFGEAIHKAILDGTQESLSMKLVDILARELKEWPEPKVPLNGGKDDCCQSDETTEVYFGFGRDSVLLSKRAENTIGVSVTRAEWQAAVDALNAPTYDFSAWPSERFDYGLLWSLYVQRFGRGKRNHPPKTEPEAAADHKDCPEFLKSRIADLEVELAERREEAKHPLHLKLSDSDLLYLIRSQSDNTLVTIDCDGRTVATVRRNIPAQTED